MTLSLNRWDFLVVLGAIFLGVYLKNRRRRSAYPYPPGPKGLPLIGNVHQIPSKDDWITYDRWCKEMGSDIIYFNGAGMEFVVLNSMEAIRDLLEKRSAIYSSRPQFPMAGELMGWGWSLPMLTYGEKWKELRRVFTRYLHPSDPSVFESKHVKFIRGMLPNLLDSPEDLFDITKNAVSGSALSIAYGIPIKAKSDPYVCIAEKAIEYLNAAVLPGNFLVNIVPVLKYVPAFFPGAGFKRFARIGRQTQTDLHTKPFINALHNLREGTARPSLATTSYQGIDHSKSKSEFDRETQIIKDAAGSVFFAAADTTLSAVRTFFVAMMYRPDVQKKAQRELDRVLSGRLPELSDEPDLPYITAIVKEVLRWKPLAPLAVPHMSTQDDVYKGYYIPKDTIVIANSWSLLMDIEHYPDRDTFNPDRFMKDEKLDPNVRDPNEIIFGYGRRICPGSHVALSFLWLTAATILSTFDISSGVDENGEPIEPNVKYHTAIVSEPLPFKCSIKPRSMEVEQLIRGLEAEWEG